MTEKERRAAVLDALAHCSDASFVLIVAAANGLLQQTVMDTASDDLPLLDAVLFYLRTRA